MSKRLYLGRLPQNITQADLEAHFKGFRLSNVRLLGNYGFVELDSPQDAEDASRDLNGRDFMGENITVELARESRRRDFYEDRGPPRGGGYDRGGGGGGYGGGYNSGPPRSAPPRKGIRIHVLGIPASTSWQDLKDYGRIGCSTVMYADIDRNNPGTGIIDFPTLEEAEEAIRRLSNVDMNNTPVKVELAPEGDDQGPPPSRGPPRDYNSYDRPRYNSYNDRGPPRESRDYDRGGSRYEDRAPPPPRRDYDRYDRDDRREYRDRSPPRRRDDDRYASSRDDRG